LIIIIYYLAIDFFDDFLFLHIDDRYYIISFHYCHAIGFRYYIAAFIDFYFFFFFFFFFFFRFRFQMRAAAAIARCRRRDADDVFEAPHTLLRATMPPARAMPRSQSARSDAAMPLPPPNVAASAFAAQCCYGTRFIDVTPDC
jgi:hypothetical protein